MTSPRAIEKLFDIALTEQRKIDDFYKTKIYKIDPKN